MKVITTRSRILSVRERWSRPYPEGRDFRSYCLDVKAIRAKLAALNLETATAADVAAILGDTRWTDLECDECHRLVDAVIEVGGPPDDEAPTARVCRACLTVALEMLEGGD